MAQTINAVNIKIGADTSLARGELNRLNTILRQTKDPAKDLSEKIDLLDKALLDGKVSLEQHATAVKSLNDRYKEANVPADTLLSTFKKYAGVAAILGAAKLTVSSFVDSMKDIDKLADTAKQLGAEYNSLKSFGLAMSEVAGISFEESVGSLQQLQTMIGQSSQGLGKGVKVFEKLGLDPRSLAEMSPTDQFQKVAQAISELSTLAERAAISEKLFGSAKVAASLGEINTAIAELSGMLPGLTKLETESVGKLNDYFGRTTEFLSAIKDRVWAEFAVAMFGASVSADDLAKSTTTAVRVVEEATKQQNQSTVEYEKQLEALNQQVNVLEMGEAYMRDFERASAGMSDEQVAILKGTEEIIERLKEKKKLEEEAARIAQQKVAIELEGQNELYRLNERFVSDQASRNRLADTFAPMIQAGTKEFFDFDREQKKKDTELLERQLQHQQAIEDATKRTADKIEKLQPVRAAR